MPESLILFDNRWIADHGIGRAAREWWGRGHFWEPIGPGPSPASPLDSIWLTRRLAHETRPFFSPGYNAPLHTRQPFFITVHDLCYVDLASQTGRARQLYTLTVIRNRCLAARAVFTVSAFSRGRLIDRFGLAPNQVVIVSPGVAEIFRQAGPAESLERPYVLGVGNSSPHKNEARTLEAFAASPLARTHLFVLTGAPRALGPAAARVQVRFVGRVEDARLAALYRGADALVFASLYEGFGSPAVEAMSCGTPVLCSRGGALEEVTAGAALLVDPQSVSDIAQGLERIVHDAPLRARLSEQGRLRAAQFDYEHSIRTLEQHIQQRLTA